MKHKGWIKNYERDFEKLAEEIGDLRYDSIADFLLLLSQKIGKDGGKDRARGRVKLANALDETAKHLKSSSENVAEAWRICEPYMFPSDVFEKVKSDFKKEEKNEAFQLISKYYNIYEVWEDDINFRFARCLIFIAKGNLQYLKDYVKMTNLDYRDLVLEAEYSEAETEAAFKWLRNFNRPFGQEKITQKDIEEESEWQNENDNLPF